MAAGAAAAEVPVLGYLAVGLLAALAFVVCMGLRTVWIHTFGFMLDELANLLDFNVGFIHFHWGAPLRRLNNIILNTIYRGAQRSEHAMGYLFHGAAVIQGWIARELLALAGDVYGWMVWFEKSHLPRWVKALIYAAVPPLVLPLIARALGGIHPTRIVRLVEGRLGVTRRQVKAMIAAALATAGAITLPLPHVLPRLKQLERDWAAIKRRLRTLEKYAGATGAVAIFAAAIAKLGLNWIRCRNVSKVGRNVCGMDTSLLGELLGDTLAIVGAISVVEFASELRKIEGEAVKIMGGLVREWPTG